MLIQFKVSNFRSIREEQTFTLVASNYDDSLTNNLVHPQLAGLSKVKLLKGAAVYGPNASGKSNVLAAFHFMSDFVKNSAMKIAPDEPTGTEPFCLDAVSKTKPSTFELMAVIDGTRYTYGFSACIKRVYHEFLIAYPKGSAQKWFERTYDPKKQKDTWNHSAIFFKLDRELCDRTRPNSLFVSMGAQFNNAQLTTIYNWFKIRLRFLNLDSESQFAPLVTARLFEEDKKLADRILALLKSADLGITTADVSHEEIGFDKIRDQIPPAVLRKIETDTQVSSFRTPLIEFHHHASDVEDQPIDFVKESAGTRRFFALVGPWLDILAHGYTVLIDELETSLHPMLVKEFLRLLFSSEHNTKGAQVIFSTHNPLFLERDIVRRDQVWFTEKDDNGATRLYQMTDYKPRRNEARLRGYLAGRYGGVPFIPEGLKM